MSQNPHFYNYLQQFDFILLIFEPQPCEKGT